MLSPYFETDLCPRLFSSPAFRTYVGAHVLADHKPRASRECVCRLAAVRRKGDVIAVQKLTHFLVVCTFETAQADCFVSNAGSLVTGEVPLMACLPALQARNQAAA